MKNQEEKFNPQEYIRVGTTYYKLIKRPTITGYYNSTLTPWSVDTIRHDIRDLGLQSGEYVKLIKKYDGFTCIPSHIDYKRSIGRFYNTYYPLSKKPVQGAITHSIKFLNHIFASQVELALDYIQLLYLKPVQILPILCLVSRKRATGKSTF